MRYILVIFIVALTGCTTYKRCEQKFRRMHIVDTVYQQVSIRVPYYVPLPYDSTGTKIDVSSWSNRLDTLRTQSGRALLTVYRLDTTYIQVSAECLPDTIIDTLVTTITVPVQTNKQTKFAPPPKKLSWWQTGLINFGIFALGIAIGIVVCRLLR